MFGSGRFSTYPYEAYIGRMVRALGVAGSGVSFWQTDTWTHARGDRLGAELCWRGGTLAERGAGGPGPDGAVPADLHVFWNPEDGWTYRWGPGHADTGARALDVHPFASPSELMALLDGLLAGEEPRTRDLPPCGAPVLPDLIDITDLTDLQDFQDFPDLADLPDPAGLTDLTGVADPSGGADPADPVNTVGPTDGPAGPGGPTARSQGGMNIGNGVVIGGPAQPVPTRRDLVGGPLDGHRLDVSTLTTDRLREGLALRTGGCAYPGGRSVYTQHPDRPDVLVWSGDIPA